MTLAERLLAKKPAKVTEAESIGNALILAVKADPEWSIHQHFTAKHGGVKILQKTEILLKNTSTGGAAFEPIDRFFVKDVNVKDKVLTLSGYIVPSKALGKAFEKVSTRRCPIGGSASLQPPHPFTGRHWGAFSPRPRIGCPSFACTIPLHPLTLHYSGLLMTRKRRQPDSLPHIRSPTGR